MLLYHFNIDKTHDCARRFRLVEYMSKKQGNNDFIVQIKKHEIYYDFEEFEKIAINYVLEEKKKKSSTKQKSKVNSTKNKTPKKTENSNISNFNKYKFISKIFNKKYKELLDKYNNDYSTADIAYARWLYFQKNLDDETII